MKRNIYYVKTDGDNGGDISNLKATATKSGEGDTGSGQVKIKGGTGGSVPLKIISDSTLPEETAGPDEETKSI